MSADSELSSEHEAKGREAAAGARCGVWASDRGCSFARAGSLTPGPRTSASRSRRVPPLGCRVTQDTLAEWETPHSSSQEQSPADGKRAEVFLCKAPPPGSRQGWRSQRSPDAPKQQNRKPPGAGGQVWGAQDLDTPSCHPEGEDSHVGPGAESMLECSCPFIRPPCPTCAPQGTLPSCEPTH